MGEVQAILTICVPTIAVLLGILINNSRLWNMQAHMDTRFGALNERFDALNQRFGDPRLKP